MKKAVVTAVLAGMISAVVFPWPARAEAEGEPVKVSLEALYAERYIWRGMPVNEEAVLQPSLTLSNGGFSLNFWGNVDLTDYGEEAGYGDEEGNATEIDYTGSYERNLGPVILGVGFVNYTFPHVGLAPTTEVFASLGLDMPLSPSITCYVDEVAEGANYTSVDLSHSFDLFESGGVSMAAELSAHAGYANGKNVETYYDTLDHAAWHDWSAGVALPVSLGGGFSLTPAYQYSSLWDEDIRDEVDDNRDMDPEAGVFMISLAWSGEL
ncbi:MAG: hypothetical protein R6V10_14580 [bacterium]